ncbi:GNAT family N-acetyltransferase [Microbaculum marinum]|uniref:GNAT family N-acetyltransferase n=1 Tax=Microbaculum marinum TaxID=1764581 RepID=A0AAW9RP60_9HYPH
MQADQALPVSDIQVYTSYQAAEERWRAFEQGALATPYQRYDWVEAWYRHVGANRGLEPLVVAAAAGGDGTVALWPLVVRSFGPIRVASWPGGKFANYNLGLYDRKMAPALDEPALNAILDRLRDAGRVDALSLRNQPEVWQGIRNPLLNLPNQPSPSFGYSLALRPDFKALYAELRSGSTRKKLRRSENRIESEYGSCTLRHVETREEVDRIIDAFIEQKAERMRERSLPNVFAVPGVMDLFRELAVRGLGTREPLLDLYWLDAGGQVAATWAGTAAGGRLCGIFNSFDMGDLAQHQPGEVLLRDLLESCCARGLTDFDLGVGEASYKDSWCPRTDRLFDSFLPLSAAGRLHSAAAMSTYRLKRAAKQSKFLGDIANRLRLNRISLVD